MAKVPLTSLSVFFPCYNEGLNLSSLIEETMRLLPTLARRYEVIIVNDGSLDQTKQIVAHLQRRFSHLKIVSHSQNRGYGAAIRTGIKAAKYDWIFFTDGDGQFTLSELSHFVSWTNEYRAILGFRKQRAEGAKRALMAKLYKCYIDALFRVHVKDIDCAFKLISADLIKSLPLNSNGAFISAEILYRLKKKKVKFKQLPVEHLPRKHGKSTGANPKVILVGLWEPFKLYLKMKTEVSL